MIYDVLAIWPLIAYIGLQSRNVETNKNQSIPLYQPAMIEFDHEGLVDSVYSRTKQPW
jgi:hypothetical protein